MNIDQNILTACVNQDRDAQSKVYNLLLPYLRAVAYRYLRDTSFVKDVLQDSFVKIFKNIDKYDMAKASLKQWSSRIVINTSLNYNDRIIGKPKDELKSHESNFTQNPKVIEYLSNEDMLEILKQLPDDLFKVFNLYVIDDYSHLEIGALLGISPILSRKRLSRARIWLKKYFHKRPDVLNGIKMLPLTLN